MRTEEPDRPHSLWGRKRVGHNWITKQEQQQVDLSMLDLYPSLE